MPDIVVHTGFGADVLKKLSLDIDRDIFNFGLLGPDPYLFYRFYLPPFRNRVNRYSTVMHNERTGEFLLQLARYAVDSREVFSYLCGFLCHYALDSTAHPYINEKAQYSPVRHMAIEHRLDRMTGKNISIPPLLPATMREAVGCAIDSVYGFSDAWEKLREGRRDMAKFYRIVADESGRLDRFTRITHSKLRLVSYRSHAIDDMNLSGFEALYQLALLDAMKFITAAERFVGGEIDEAALRSVIGDRSYIKG